MEFQEEGTLTKCTFSRMHFFEIWTTLRGSVAEKSRHILLVFQNTINNENLDIGPLRKRVFELCKRMDELWKAVNRTKIIFLKKYVDWLNVIECVELKISNENCTTTEDTEILPSTSTADSANRVRGRPKKDFAKLSKRSKRRRLTELSQVDNSTVDALLNMSDISNSSITTNISPDEVLSLFVEAKLTKHQYLLIKNFINTKTASHILPTYHSVLAAKKKCYPQDIIVSESKAEIELQSLLDHTVTRILESQKNVIDSVSLGSEPNLTLIGKWGFDGSTGHSEYKQSFTDSNSDDCSLFVTSYVPLQLVVDSNVSEKKILWKNPRPSSTRYCRPIRFQFTKESSMLSREEASYFREKISNLKPTNFTCNDTLLSIKHCLQLTMVDGKICSALSESSSSRCYICKATPSEMNKIDICLKKPSEEACYEFGLSPLHSWIRFFEYFIHLVYRVNIKKWQIRSDEDKKLFLETKKSIQNKFRTRLGLIVDKPRSGGSGTSNDGNTARKFFLNSTVAAEITDLNKDLIDRCSVILQALSSGYNIQIDKFRNYALETARLLVNEYPWYNLPASVHKVLLHGPEIIQHALLSIGELSEEAAETNNKNIKAYRRDHTRKMTRELTNADLLHRLMLSSDPYITSLRKLPQKKKSIYLSEVQDLLQV